MPTHEVFYTATSIEISNSIHALRCCLVLTAIDYLNFLALKLNSQIDRVEKRYADAIGSSLVAVKAELTSFNLLT